jgi:hypothetical protein
MDNQNNNQSSQNNNQSDQNNSSDGIVSPVQVQKFLAGIDYPATKEKLIETAQSMGVDQKIIDTLNRLPTPNFNSPNDVSEAIGKLN